MRTRCASPDHDERTKTTEKEDVGRSPPAQSGDVNVASPLRVSRMERETRSAGPDDRFRTASDRSQGVTERSLQDPVLCAHALGGVADVQAKVPWGTFDQIRLWISRP